MTCRILKQLCRLGRCPLSCSPPSCRGRYSLHHTPCHSFISQHSPAARMWATTLIPSLRVTHRLPRAQAVTPCTRSVRLPSQPLHLSSMGHTAQVSSQHPSLCLVLHRSQRRPAQHMPVRRIVPSSEPRFRCVGQRCRHLHVLGLPGQSTSAKGLAVCIQCQIQCGMCVDTCLLIGASHPPGFLMNPALPYVLLTAGAGTVC